MSEEISDERLLEIYESLDELFWDGKFDTCDTIMRELDIKNTDTGELLAYVCAIYVVRDKLPYREEYKEKVRLEFESRGIEGVFENLK